MGIALKSHSMKNTFLKKDLIICNTFAFFFSQNEWPFQVSSKETERNSKNFKVRRSGTVRSQSDS